MRLSYDPPGRFDFTHFEYPFIPKRVVFPFFEDSIYRFPSGRGIQIQFVFKSFGISIIHSGIQRDFENSTLFSKFFNETGREFKPFKFVYAESEDSN